MTLRSRGTCLGLAAGLLALALGAPPAHAQATITTEQVGIAETEAGNIVADAVRAAGGADIGIVPAVAFKPGASAPRPAPPERAVRLVEPANDPVVVLNLRGAQILAALERSVSFAPQRSSSFLQVSGLRFTYDPSRPGGRRVVSATVGGKPLEAATVYKVATTRPLATGQQGYFQIWDRSQISAETGKTLADALNDLARGGTLTAPPEGRINVRGKG